MFQKAFLWSVTTSSILLFGAADAAAPTTAGSPLSGWESLTALTALIAVLLFIITKMLPDLQNKFIEQSKIFSAALKESDANFVAVLDKMHERSEERSKAVAEALTRLREHCAGKND